MTLISNKIKCNEKKKKKLMFIWFSFLNICRYCPGNCKHLSKCQPIIVNYYITDYFINIVPISYIK